MSTRRNKAYVLVAALLLLIGGFLFLNDAVGSRLPGWSRVLCATFLLGRLLPRAHLRPRSWVVPSDVVEAPQNQLNLCSQDYPSSVSPERNYSKRSKT